VVAVIMNWKVLAAGFLALVTFATLLARKTEEGDSGSRMLDSVAAASTAGETGPTLALPATAPARERLEEVAAAPLPDAPSAAPRCRACTSPES
jgi:hypothetical protein